MGEPSVSNRRSCSAVARLPAWLSSCWSRVSKSSIDRSKGTVTCRVMPSGDELTTWAAMAWLLLGEVDGARAPESAAKINIKSRPYPSEGWGIHRSAPAHGRCPILAGDIGPATSEVIDRQDDGCGQDDADGHNILYRYT